MRVLDSPSVAAKNAPSPMRHPCETPTQKAVNSPSGASFTSARSEIGSGTTRGGAVDADNDTGTSASEISAEDSTKSLTPPGSARLSISWPAPIPPIVTIM